MEVGGSSIWRGRKTKDIKIISSAFSVRFWLRSWEWLLETIRRIICQEKQSQARVTKHSEFPDCDRADPMFNPVLNNDTSRELNRPSDSFYPSIRIFLINFNLETQIVSVLVLYTQFSLSASFSSERKCISYRWIWSAIKISKQTHCTKPGYEGPVLV